MPFLNPFSVDLFFFVINSFAISTAVVGSEGSWA